MSGDLLKVKPCKKVKAWKNYFHYFSAIPITLSPYGNQWISPQVECFVFLFLQYHLHMQFSSFSTQVGESHWKTEYTCWPYMQGTINFHLSDGTTYCIATLHTANPFNISKLITVAILKPADSRDTFFHALLCLSVCICMLNKVKTSTAKQ